MAVIVIPSVPATFSYNLAPTNVSFAIPAGVWTSGQWDVVGNQPAGSGHTDTVGTYPSMTSAPFIPQASGPFSETRVVTGGQMGDVNLQAGSNLSVDMTSSDVSIVNATSFTLTLTGTPSGGGGGTTQGEIIHHSPHFSDSANAQRSIVRHG